MTMKFVTSIIVCLFFLLPCIGYCEEGIFLPKDTALTLTRDVEELKIKADALEDYKKAEIEWIKEREAKDKLITLQEIIIQKQEEIIKLQEYSISRVKELNELQTKSYEQAIKNAKPSFLEQLQKNIFTSILGVGIGLILGLK